MKKILLLMCFVSGLAQAQTPTFSVPAVVKLVMPAITETVTGDVHETNKPRDSVTNDEVKVRSEIIKLAIEQKDGTLKTIQAIKITIVKSVFITGPHITSFYLSLDGEKIKEGILIEKL